MIKAKEKPVSEFKVFYKLSFGIKFLISGGI